MIEIEAPHFVWAIVRAVAGANTTVIDLQVEAFGIVQRRFDRTNHLTIIIPVIATTSRHISSIGKTVINSDQFSMVMW